MHYVLLKDRQGRMIVRTQTYWTKHMAGDPNGEWLLVTDHISSSALLKMIEIATDNMPDDEKKRMATADNSPEHVNKTEIIH
jgi:hypothetical protein